MMKKNMAAVREDFSSRMNNVKEDATATKESYEEELEKLENKYKNAVLKYNPVTYNRNHGWQGRTYTEALVFCGSKAGYAVCPYDVICPAGPDTTPLGGNIASPSSEPFKWMPVLDSPNEWVQVRVFLFDDIFLLYCFVSSFFW